MKNCKAFFYCLSCFKKNLYTQLFSKQNMAKLELKSTNTSEYKIKPIPSQSFLLIQL